MDWLRTTLLYVVAAENIFLGGTSVKPNSEIGAGALFGPILRAFRAKNGVPPVMHDLIIFRALFSDFIPLRFY